MSRSPSTPWLLLTACLLLAGCERPVRDWTTDKEGTLTQQGLEGCTFHKVDTGSTFLYVVRCPHSDVGVTYRQGKSKRQTATVQK